MLVPNSLSYVTVFSDVAFCLLILIHESIMFHIQRCQFLKMIGGGGGANVNFDF